MTSIGGIAQTNAPDQVMEEQDYSASGEMGEAYEQYQSTLKEIFTNIKLGALQAASEALVNVSDWLLTKVAELGSYQRLQNNTGGHQGSLTSKRAYRGR